MKCCPLFLFLFLLPGAARAEPTSAEALAGLLKQQETLEKGGASWALQQLNQKIAQLSREIMLKQGYKVGEVVPNPAVPTNFIFTLLGGPEGSDVHKVIQAAGEHLKINYVIQVGGIHFGLYDETRKQVRLSPKFLLMAQEGKRGIFSTILHETRHAFIWAKAAKGIASPLNVDVISRGTTQVTPVELYEKYFHFQEMSTHFRDFHYAMSGVPTTYTLDGLSLKDVALMKARKTLQFAEAIKKQSAAAIESLEKGLASTGVLVRDNSLSRSGMAVVVPIAEPGSSVPYADLRVLLPGLGPEVPDAVVREKAVAVLEKSLKEAKRTGDSAQEQLTEFQANPVVGKAPCGAAFGLLLGGT